MHNLWRLSVKHFTQSGGSWRTKMMRVVKTLVCREGKDNASKKLDPIQKDALVRLIETSEMLADGTYKVRVALASFCQTCGCVSARLHVCMWF